MTDLLERLPENFEMITMQLRAKPLLEGEAGPFVVVALQVILCFVMDAFSFPVGLDLQRHACALASSPPHNFFSFLSKQRRRERLFFRSVHV